LLSILLSGTFEQEDSELSSNSDVSSNSKCASRATPLILLMVRRSFLSCPSVAVCSLIMLFSSRPITRIAGRFSATTS
ncbi:hypothetical protein PFISCL1PPCAC_8762, partial [Pristionchus fissidentatus]